MTQIFLRGETVNIYANGAGGASGWGAHNGYSHDYTSRAMLTLTDDNFTGYSQEGRAGVVSVFIDTSFRQYGYGHAFGGGEHDGTGDGKP